MEYKPIKFQVRYDILVFLREKHIDLNKIIDYIEEEKEIFEESFSEIIVPLDEKDELLFTMKRSKNDALSFTITGVKFIPAIWGVKRGGNYYITKKNIKDVWEKQIPLGEYLIDPHEIYPKMVRLRPSSANPITDKFDFPKSDFDDHFDIAKPRSINIADQSYLYLLTDSEYECCKIFMNLMNNTDLKELKEKLMKIK